MLRNLLLLALIVKSVVSDTPANCSYEDVIGKWQFYSGKLSMDCTSVPLIKSRTVSLMYPDIAVDQFGNQGRWTLIYNQGFEVVISNMKYFGFFDFKQVNKTNAISYCDRLRPLWQHDVLLRQWSCFKATKMNKTTVKTLQTKFQTLSTLPIIDLYSQQKIVQQINSQNLHWTAQVYSDLNGKSYDDLIKMAGGSKSKIVRPKPAPVNREHLEATRFLPKSFDWRNVSGVNYVSPVRNQAKCGSCYSFASAGMLEARFRIRSNNTVKPILSPQDVVECSVYSQGCSGGFPYLIAGKYAEDFGMASESCNPYRGVDGKCRTSKVCQRYYATQYRYVGGYYGGSNEELMKLELVRNGPVAVGFQVYSDFMQYSSGVYHHKFTMPNNELGFNPFELTNHAVLVVGYGETPQGEKYWIVKNSWGPGFGLQGYFWIRRGNDECGIESLSVAAEPVLNV